MLLENAEMYMPPTFLQIESMRYKPGNLHSGGAYKKTTAFKSNTNTD